MAPIAGILVPAGLISLLGCPFPAYYALLFCNKDIAHAVVIWVQNAIQRTNTIRVMSVTDTHIPLLTLLSPQLVRRYGHLKVNRYINRTHGALALLVIITMPYKKDYCTLGLSAFMDWSTRCCFICASKPMKRLIDIIQESISAEPIFSGFAHVRHRMRWVP